MSRIVLPKMVTVPPRDISINELPLEEAERLRIYGDYSYDRGRIRVCTARCSRREVAITLMHEIGHPICAEMDTARRVHNVAAFWLAQDPTKRISEEAYLEALEDLIVETTFDAAAGFFRYSGGVARWIQRNIERG